MEKIKNITVKVEYTVGLGGLIASKKVLKQLKEIADKCNTIDFATLEYDEARDWIQQNIKESDCFEASFEIIELECDPPKK